MPTNENKLRTVHWKELQGNKWSKSLHPAMLNENGYRTTQKTRAVGESSYGGEYSVVIYDREYVIGWLTSKVIKPLSDGKFIPIVDLLKEAHKTLYPMSTDMIPTCTQLDD